MRTRHAEGLHPICPVCKTSQSDDVTLALTVAKGTEHWIEEGQFFCPRCRQLYPIIHGIPILVPNPEDYIRQSVLHLLNPLALSPFTTQWIGQSAGPDSAFELTRQYLSTYAWAHYSDLIPHPPIPDSGLVGITRSMMAAGISAEGPRLDLGCSVGRSTHLLAEETTNVCLGVDISFSKVHFAQQTMRQQMLRFGLRQVGTVYHTEEHRITLPHMSRVDFWVADATCLPFKNDQFGVIHSQNLLDCIHHPINHLAEMVRCSSPEGSFSVVCPYDWSAQATALDHWIGGTRQFSGLRGAPEDTLRWILSPESPDERLHCVEILKEQAALPWRIRVHARSTMHYEVHLLTARKS